MQIVELPDGSRVEFPDGTPEHVITSTLRRDYPQWGSKSSQETGDAKPESPGFHFDENGNYLGHIEQKPSAKIGTEQLPMQNAGNPTGISAESKKPWELQYQTGTHIPPQPDNSHTVAWGAGAAVLVAVALLAWFKFKKTETTSGVSTAAQSPIHEQTEKCYAEEAPHDLQLGTAKGNAMFCTQCGTAINASDKFCAKCGTAVSPARGDSTPPTSAPKPITDSAATALSLQDDPTKLTQQDSLPVTGSVVYAGFWHRFAASFLDNCVLLIIFIPVAIVQKIGEGTKQNLVVLGASFIALAASAIYFTIMESGESGASYGKRWLGLKVLDVHGNRITKGRAFARWIAHFLSYITFYIGFFIQPFTARKQALHDMVAKTVIVQTGQSKASSRIVIAISVCIVAIFFMGIIAAIAIPAYHDYIDKRKLASAISSDPVLPANATNPLDQFGAKQPKTSTETEIDYASFLPENYKQPKTSTETVKAARPTANIVERYDIAAMRKDGYSLDKIADTLVLAAGIDPTQVRARGYSSYEMLAQLGYPKALLDDLFVESQVAPPR